MAKKSNGHSRLLYAGAIVAYAAFAWLIFRKTLGGIM